MLSFIFKGIGIKNRTRTIEIESHYRIDLTRLGLQSIEMQLVIQQKKKCITA
jgi:hypothetical protein